MMFFKRASSQPKSDLVETLMTRKEKIQKKLKEVGQLNDRLTATIEETRAISSTIATKLKKEPKLVRKSFTSISNKLKTGVMILNHRGEVLHLNPAGEAIFKIKENDVIDKSFTELLTAVESTKVEGQKVELAPNMFDELSATIIEHLKSNEDLKSQICFKCIKAKFPKFFDLEKENLIKVYSPCMKTRQTLKFSVSVLDNDPDDINDITYVFIFRKYCQTRRQR